MVERNKLAIFDLDGTLFDTSNVNYCAYKEAAGRYGYQIKRDDFLKIFNGRNYGDFLPLLGIEGKTVLEKIHDIKKDIYKGYLSEARVNKHLLSVLCNIRNMYQTALVTTASRKNALELLDAFSITDCFDWFVFQEDVRNLKPDPECYYKVMRQAKIAPEDTLIFEDSEAGVLAAEQCKAAVCQVRCF